MDNDQTRAVLEAQRNALNKVLNAMTRYHQEVAASRWSGTVKAAQMRAIKASALAGGVDISAWTGLPAE